MGRGKDLPFKRGGPVGWVDDLLSNQARGRQMNKITYPTLRITDPNFVYTPWYNTDVRITWRKASRVNALIDRIKEPKHAEN